MNALAQPVPRRLWRRRSILLVTCLLWTSWAVAQTAPHCQYTFPTNNSDPTHGQVNWSPVEAGCDPANPINCDGHTPDTGGDGTTFTFNVRYFSTVDNNPVQEAYLFIDTNGDGNYPCDPKQIVGGVGTLDAPSRPMGPWPLAALGLTALACVWLAVRRAHARPLRLTGAVGLALLTALGCGKGSSSATSQCAQFEAYTLASLTGNPGSGLDLNRAITLCGRARTISFVFYISTVIGHIGGPAGNENQMQTQ